MKKIIRNLNLLLLLILISCLMILSSCVGNFENCKFELKENTISPSLDLDLENLDKLKNIEDVEIKQKLIYNKQKEKFELVEKE